MDEGGGAPTGVNEFVDDGGGPAGVVEGCGRRLLVPRPRPSREDRRESGVEGGLEESGTTNLPDIRTRSPRASRRLVLRAPSAGHSREDWRAVQYQLQAASEVCIGCIHFHSRLCRKDRRSSALASALLALFVYIANQSPEYRDAQPESEGTTMESRSLNTASTYINNLLLSRGLLRDGTPIDFATPEKTKGGTDATMVKIMNLVHDLILRRDVGSHEIARCFHVPLY